MFDYMNEKSTEVVISAIHEVLSIINKGLENSDKFTLTKNENANVLTADAVKLAEQIYREHNISALNSADLKSLSDRLYTYLNNRVGENGSKPDGRELLNELRRS